MEKVNTTENLGKSTPKQLFDSTSVMGAYEIGEGMSIEEMRAIYFDADALIEPTERLYQLNRNGMRWYYSFDEQGEATFYPSVTTVLKHTMPENNFLTGWKLKMGKDEAMRYTMERAAYGTFMHGAFEELLINKTYDLDALPEKLAKYVDSHNLASDFVHYADDLKKDILAFAQFIKDYEVKPLAVEISLAHPIYKYAGMIDLVCELKPTPKAKERIMAIVDFKSGRNGFYEEHEIQLGMYRDMWNTIYTDKPITKIYNFSPKDWRKSPSYNFKDQTDSPNIAKLPSLLALYEIEQEKEKREFVVVSGNIDLDTDLTDNYKTLTMAEIVKERTKRDEPSVEDLNHGIDAEGNLF